MPTGSIADIGDLEPQFATGVADGRYKRISMSFYKPGVPSNPAGNTLYPKHVGFLGAAAPAVPGLKPVEFAGDADEAETIELAEPAFKDVASLFRKLREFLIEKFDIETADQAVPEWRVNWIDDAGTETQVQSDFSNPEDDTMVDKPKKTEPAGTVDLAAREAEIAKREKAADDREAEQRHAEHEAFAEGLIDAGKLPTGHKAKVVALLDGIAAGDGDAVSFADGDSETKTDLLSLTKTVLDGQPKIVEFGEQDLGEEPDIDAEDSTAIAAQAVAFQSAQREAGIEVSTSDAVDHVMKQKGLDA